MPWPKPDAPGDQVCECLGCRLAFDYGIENGG